MDPLHLEFAAQIQESTVRLNQNNCMNDLLLMYFVQSLVYVGASDLCNELVFTLGGNPVGTTPPNRMWSIKVF